MCTKENINESEIRKLLDAIKERCSCQGDCDYILSDHPNWSVTWINDLNMKCSDETQKLKEKYRIIWGM